MTRIVTYESYTPVYIRVQWILSADILLLFYLPQRGTFFNAVMPYVLYLIITSAFSLDFYICFIFQYNECLIMFFTPYNFTIIFPTIKGPVSQETVLVLFHRRYPTVPILLSSKIPFVLSDCVMFMWSITIHVLCMTHESTATPFCVNKNLYIYVKCVRGRMIYTAAAIIRVSCII